jgi:uncharacterized protein YndB with AHSA1/START domain
MNELSVNDSVEIAAAPARVWQMLTDPQWTKQYMFGCEALSDWTVGSALVWKGAVDGREVVFVKGDIVAIERERLLQYTVFDPQGGLEDIPANYLTVTCRLVAHDGGTRLDVSQGDFARVGDGQRRYEHTVAGGGWGTILAKIKSLSEG